MNFIKRALLSVRKRLSKTFLMLLVFFAIGSLVLAGLSISSASDKAKELAREKLGATVTLKVNTEELANMMREEMRESGVVPDIEIEPLDMEVVYEIGSYEEVLGYNITNDTSLIAGNFEFVKDTDLESQRQDLDDFQKDLEDQAAEYEEAKEAMEEAKEAMEEFEKELENQAGDRGAGGMPDMPDMDFDMPGLNFDMDFELSNTDINAVAIHNLIYDEDFSNGTNELIEGDYITEEHAGQNVTIIEEEIADLNDLTIGDTIIVYDSTEEIETELEIIGIYKTEDKYGTNISRISSESQIPANQIYIPLEVAVDESIVEDSNSLEIQYTMTDPIYIDSFIEKVSEIEEIDYDYYVLDANNDEYEKMMGPIENVSQFATLGLYGITIAGAIILSLIAMIAIKDRKYELGVLLSIGESKWKLISQLVIESVMILLLSCILTYPVSGVISNEIGDVLLQSEVEVLEEQENNMGFAGRDMDSSGSDSLNNVEVIDELDITVSLEDVINLLLIGILITIISTIIPALEILRFNPKTILTNRD